MLHRRMAGSFAGCTIVHKRYKLVALTQQLRRVLIRVGM